MGMRTGFVDRTRMYPYLGSSLLPAYLREKKKKRGNHRANENGEPERRESRRGKGACLQPPRAHRATA
jgi:hypothetical protein